MRFITLLTVALVGLVGLSPSTGAAPSKSGDPPAARSPAMSPKRAKRKPRVAVLILQTGAASSELADNLTEVLIVNLAAGGRYKVIGKEVVKSQLGGAERLVLQCVGNRTCIGNVATTLGLDYLIVGTLGKRIDFTTYPSNTKLEDTWLYNLYFIDAASAAEVKRIHKRVKGDATGLTKSLGDSLALLLKPKIKPGTVRIESNVAGAKIHIDDQFAGTAPLRRDNLKPGVIRLRVEADGHYAALRKVTVAPGKVVVVRVVLRPVLKRRKTWKFHVAFSTLGVSLAAAVAAGVTGGLSRKARGTTQAELLADLKRRRKLALAANVLIGVSAAAAVTSAAFFIFTHRGFFAGGRERRVHLEITPLAGGAFVSGGIQW